ncbi:MAG TPA: Lrp/AsnC family transcriptional regulator [Candidatus Bilamarchaeaceae archaeon]|nr:Lrp/AsnC family transcriptional regulator [Candidatus Bilamarchaeaceae archaeon]
MRLDAVDKNILAVLDLEARATFQEIGKRTRLSKERVIYRIKRLEQRGIIERYLTLVNFGKLGYTGFAVYSRFENVNEKVKKELLDYLSSIPQLYWIALVGGRFDIAFALMCQSVFEFNQIYYKILNKYGKTLADNVIAIRAELRQNKRGYLVGWQTGSVEPPFFGREPETEKVNELDASILSILSNNARMPVTDIARMLTKPPSTISLRIKQLEKKGIIQGYATYIRPQKYSMESYRLLLYLENINENVRNKVFGYSYENPFMILCIETVGPWNFEISLEVDDHQQLQEEITKLRNEFSGIVKQIEFVIMFEDDLIYDPYPLKKKERLDLIKTRTSPIINKRVEKK